MGSFLVRFPRMYGSAPALAERLAVLANAWLTCCCLSACELPHRTSSQTRNPVPDTGQAAEGPINSSALKTKRLA